MHTCVLVYKPHLKCFSLVMLMSWWKKITTSVERKFGQNVSGQGNLAMFIQKYVCWKFSQSTENDIFWRKRNRRVDVLVDTLLQIEKILFLTRLRRISFNLPSEENISNADRHQRSLNIDAFYKLIIIFLQWHQINRFYIWYQKAAWYMQRDILF